MAFLFLSHNAETQNWGALEGMVVELVQKTFVHNCVNNLNVICWFDMLFFSIDSRWEFCRDFFQKKTSFHVNNHPGTWIDWMAVDSPRIPQKIIKELTLKDPMCLFIPFTRWVQLNPSFAQKIRGKSWLVLDTSIEEFAVHTLGYLSHNRASNPCCQREKGRAKDLTQFFQSAKSR